MEMMLICAFDLHHMILIPMDPYYSVSEQVVFGAHARHCVFEKEGVAHCFVGSGAELVEECQFHVTGEFLGLLVRFKETGVG